MQTFVAPRPTSINRVQQPITLDQIRRFAPSAFAEAPHESRSSRYAQVKTIDVIEGLMADGFQPFSAVQSRTNVPGKENFTKHMIRFRHVSTGIARQVGDVVPEVAVVNSHDGSSAYWIMEAMYRLTCLNGMFVDHAGGQTFKVQHTGNIIDQVVQGSFAVIDRSVKALDVVNDWSRLRLTNGEQQAFAHAAHELRFANADGEVSTPITPAQLLTPRRAEDTEGYFSSLRPNGATAAPDLWRTLNVVQENVIKGGLHGVARSTDERGNPTKRKVTTRTINGIDQDVKLNRAMWRLAEEMAKLKTAAA